MEGLERSQRRHSPFVRGVIAAGVTTSTLLLTGCVVQDRLTRKVATTTPTDTIAHSDIASPIRSRRLAEEDHTTVWRLEAAREAEAVVEAEILQTSASASLGDHDRLEPARHWVTAESPTAYSPAAMPAGGLTLADLEALALANNPAIKELAAITQKAAGYRTQVLARPNPTLGYQGQQLADRGTDQHLIFLEREFVTGNKLQLNQRVQNAAVCAQLQELNAQRLRVTTDIRVRFYEALALQRQIELIDEFETITAEGVRIAELRKQAAEGSQIDVLQAQIQQSEIALRKQQTQARLTALERELAALAGVPYLTWSRLEGSLPADANAIEWDAMAEQIVALSPEYSAARMRISRAHAALERQNVQPIPNVGVQLGAGVDNGTNSGMLNLQVGVPLPINNRNEGNISAARAELCRAQMEAERIRSDIKARLAVVSQEYETALVAVHQYELQILPNAAESMQLAEQAYQAGVAEFVQILIARRTYFDSHLEYVLAQSRLAGAQAKIDGRLLTGALDPVRDDSGDDSLRGLTFSQE